MFNLILLKSFQQHLCKYTCRYKRGSRKFSRSDEKRTWKDASTLFLSSKVWLKALLWNELTHPTLDSHFLPLKSFDICFSCKENHFFWGISFQIQGWLLDEYWYPQGFPIAVLHWDLSVKDVLGRCCWVFVMQNSGNIRNNWKFLFFCDPFNLF
jgi:hypothetical protein